MRLLNTKNVPQLQEFIGDDDSIPPYAILSHTWEDQEEVTFQALSGPLAGAQKKGFLKIQQTCALAAQNGYDWAWVDTCCIDKLASAELSEAINSMFRWYQNAAVCYVFLSDLEPGANLDTSLPKCRWFTRGWTLQELIAPRVVLFYDRDWKYRGNKDELADLVARTTRIPKDILSHQTALSEVAVARRMSWASRRSTTRVEDMAYCLLGIFGVHMSLVYGERNRAFSRLQETIVQTTGDLSIFVWTNNDEDCPEYTGFFADTPRRFEPCFEMYSTLEDSIYRDLNITTRGIHLEASLAQLYLPGAMHQPVLDPYCKVGSFSIGIYLRKIGGNRYARWKPRLLVQFDKTEEVRKPSWAESASVILDDIFNTASSTTYLGQKLQVDKLLLATTFPDTFPFHATDPVLGNRHSALRLSWEIQDSLPLENSGHRVFPRSHWDRHDRVFFCANRISYSWCATILEFKVNKEAQNRGTQTPNITLFIACFYWNFAQKGRPFLMLASMDSIGKAIASIFEFTLDRTRFECARGDAAPLIRKTFGDNLVSNEEEFGNPSIIIGSEIEVTLALRTNVACPDICVNPMTLVDVSVRKKR
ncbi:heterokaryon incompatibility protein-domain-containing protein [Cercophora newfieldiana]|uniref:Heterokaryon incompatibility protein-domain-containing protein n=1 Tax=Cercophora newfieldiana TaxID=92897 RepID=A0AA39YSC4_9PEZI|nr:heterokaryon incompatibility protein-domain-containing protein [Cercophora newfieldiana]